MKRNIISNDYKKRCFVLVYRNIGVDRLALRSKCTARKIERRQTVCGDEHEENVLFNESDKENHPTINSILKKTKRPPFHVRGRRKSIHSFVPDEDIVNFDHRQCSPPSSHSMQQLQADDQERPEPPLISIQKSQVAIQMHPAPPLVPIQQCNLNKFPLDQPSTSQGLQTQTNNADILHMLNAYESDDSD